ncbi:MAG: squalene/phytoene synthase family protein [Hyphomonadaceae bacterium]
MSDTPTPANLASSEEFDARLKRTDEDRWLATRYAPQAGRERLVAIYLLNQELQRTLHTKEPMLGKIRLQWWRETLEQVAGKAPLRRHDLAEELARVTKGRPDLIAPLSDLIDRFDDIIDDHMHGGHTTGGDHEARHLATEGSLTRLAGIALDQAAGPEHLDAFARAGEAHIASIAGLPDAAAKWNAARAAVRKAPAPLWPAILHLAVANTGKTQRSALSKRWRMFRAALTRRL